MVNLDPVSFFKNDQKKREYDVDKVSAKKEGWGGKQGKITVSLSPTYLVWKLMNK